MGNPGVRSVTVVIIFSTLLVFSASQLSQPSLVSIFATLIKSQTSCGLNQPSLGKISNYTYSMKLSFSNAGINEPILVSIRIQIKERLHTL